MRDNLTPKQRKFVTAYLGLGNGVKAAELAGYKGNANTLAVVSAENLRKPNIQSALVKHVDSTGVTEKHISNEIAKVAFSEASDPLRNDHKLKALQLLAKIKGMTTNVQQTNVVGTMQLIQFRSGQPENEAAEQVLSV